jgi:hypothetical protein
MPSTSTTASLSSSPLLAHCQMNTVYTDYFVQTLHPSYFNCTMSKDGMIATLSMGLPLVIADFGGCAKAREHSGVGVNESLFIAGAHNTTNSIAALYPNFEEVTPPGQQDPLPFPCKP